MASRTEIIAQNEQELLHELTRHTYEPRKSDFSQVGSVSVYNLPPQSDKSVVLNGYDFTGHTGSIRGLNLPQQLMLLKLLSERFGRPFRHLVLQENFNAVYSPDGQAYKKNVLVPFWVLTGEIIKKLGDSYQIGRAKGAEFSPAGVPSDHDVFERETPQQTSGLTVIRYKLGPVLQTEVPTKTGYFTDLKGIIPIDSEIRKERQDTGRTGYWNGQYFENNLSAVWCCWHADGQGLYASAHRPLHRYDGGGLGIGTDAHLNK